ncbi:MAG: hypothetical protein M3R26_01400, partial [Actinomycetota bacterium]|nr:hypothetical protein [Actinomycetota bacterium]
ACVGRLPSEQRQLARPLGEERVPPQPQRRRPVRKLGPAAAGGAVLRRGVDEEDGLANAV